MPAVLLSGECYTGDCDKCRYRACEHPCHDADASVDTAASMDTVEGGATGSSDPDPPETSRTPESCSEGGGHPTGPVATERRITRASEAQAA